MPESPSELLTRAADLIRDRAAAVEGQAWRYDDEWGLVRGGNAYPVAEARSAEVGRWISLLSPAVAPAIEEWLREAAKHLRAYNEHEFRQVRCVHCSPARDFARAVVGEDQP